MPNTPPFVLYNASAGSGKTYALVREFLKTIFSDSSQDFYKHLLAITFTNKAVAEMKERIIDQLMLFSEVAIPDEKIPMLIQISADCNVPTDTIRKRSKTILHHILHHYAALSVETIDGFNHRLIRTFARDLKLNSNFEVSLEQNDLLERAVDNLIARTGEDKEITDTLINYALLKTDEDKSWDIAWDITKMCKILFNENDLVHVNSLSNKSLNEFNQLNKELGKKRKGLLIEIEEIGTKTLELISESGLQYNDFNRSYLPKYFEKLTTHEKDVKFNLVWQNTLEEKPLYPKRVEKESPHIIPILEELSPQFFEAFHTSKVLVLQERFLHNILKNLTPLSVINLVKHELDLIKEEENLLTISEFNQRINDEIKDQPAPFIYERLGERYRHFFIDEFQDTSRLQWENLIPLIDNALSQEYQNSKQGSLLMVGDAKQSIYRWRGGDPEQFIALSEDENPFSVKEKQLLNLEVNWRSCDNIIRFNNDFFTHLAQFFDDPTHTHLYEIGNKQNTNNKEGGYVQFQFVEADKNEELDTLYPEQLFLTISELISEGYSLRDMSILTRTSKQGIAVGEYLSERGIDVVSSESLLLEQSPKVRFLNDCLLLKYQPNSNEVKVRMLLFLHQHLNIKIEKSDLLVPFFSSEENTLSSVLQKFGVQFSNLKLHSLPIYEAAEYCVKTFDLLPEADAYVDGFMNLVFDFQEKQLSANETFEDYWDRKKRDTAIASPKDLEAVNLLTIHKAKGLEFPVVFFPYADVDLYREIEAKAWIDGAVVNSGFNSLMIDYKEEVASYGDFGEVIHTDRRKKLQLDNINLLYVTFTRAIERLYVFSKKSKLLAENSPKTYSEFFIEYLSAKLLWNDSELTYSFGVKSPPIKLKKDGQRQSILPKYTSSFPGDYNLYFATRDASLWFTDAEKAISEGTFLHEVMSRIHYYDDVESALDSFRSQRSEVEFKLLKQQIRDIVSHPDLRCYYETTDTIENERDIITQSGEILRPDRINIHPDGSVTIIDYKTGSVSARYTSQLNQYASAIATMGFPIRDKLIIYTSETGISINKL